MITECSAHVHSLYGNVLYITPHKVHSIVVQHEYRTGKPIQNTVNYYLQQLYDWTQNVIKTQVCCAMKQVNVMQMFYEHADIYFIKEILNYDGFQQFFFFKLGIDATILFLDVLNINLKIFYCVFLFVPLRCLFKLI